ncbi:hypothetical protein JCM17042A_17250 [Ruminococcus champanellensis 18P13 = JCM 17042]
MGKEESGGLGEKTRKGKGDCSRAAPLPLGCLPKTAVNPYCVTLARRKNKMIHKQMVTISKPAKLSRHAEHKEPHEKIFTKSQTAKRAAPGDSVIL